MLITELLLLVKKKLHLNSEEYSELDTTPAAMMLFNNGYAVMMDTSSMMMDNTLQVIIQPSKAKHSTYCYFSSTIEASAFSHCKSYND